MARTGCSRRGPRSPGSTRRTRTGRNRPISSRCGTPSRSSRPSSGRSSPCTCTSATRSPRPRPSSERRTRRSARGCDSPGRGCAANSRSRGHERSDARRAVRRRPPPIPQLAGRRSRRRAERDRRGDPDQLPCRDADGPGYRVGPQLVWVALAGLLIAALLGALAIGAMQRHVRRDRAFRRDRWPTRPSSCVSRWSTTRPR